MKDKFDINMTGNQYLRYLKYKDNKRENKKPLTQKQIGILFIFISLSMLFIAMIVIYFILFPSAPAPPFGSTVVLGFLINNALLGFLLICVGIAWVLHGFGFIIIRR